MGGFTVIASLIAAWLGGGMSAGGIVASFVYTVCIGSLCSAAGHLVWPRVERLSRPVRWVARTASMGLAVSCGTLLAILVLQAAGAMRARDFWGTYWANLQFAAFITVTVGGALMVYEYWRGKYESSELGRERALKLATEARLASLESRIHPHFLFNTLNSISSLIHSDPMQADAQLQRLCALLRFSLDASETPLVTLEQEMKIVRDYLDIEKTRFGDRLRFTLDVPPALLAFAVPPLAVQTLVENSVKHVIAPSRAGGVVSVAASRDGGRLVIVVEDGGPGVGALLPGHGLDNLQARLDVLFGDRARLAFGPSAVRLEVPV
jgi:signal transduction histidine kinase